MSDTVRWQIVPVIPTARMTNAGNAHLNDKSAMLSAWNEMLEAAPDAPCDAAVSAILCAIKDRNGLHFLRTWVTADLQNRNYVPPAKIAECESGQKIAPIRESSVE